MQDIQNRIFKTLQEKYMLEKGEDIALQKIYYLYQDAYKQAVQTVLNEGKNEGAIGRPFTYDILDELAYDYTLKMLGIE